MSTNPMLDGMLGLTVGDALGDPVQFMSREEVQCRGKVTGMEDGGPFGTPAGTWTDDSSLALATLESLQRRPEADLVDIASNFSDWLNRGKFTPFGHAFDIGTTCWKAIKSFDMCHNPMRCGVTGEYANGNGALMRILPACVLFADRQMKGRVSLDSAVRSVERIAALTHNHHRTNMACGLYFFMVRSIMNGADSLAAALQQGADEGFAYYDRRDAEKEPELDCLRDLSTFAACPEDDIRASGYVVETLKAALWSLLNSSCFRDALLTAVNLGDDTDTVGAVCGGLAGVFYGREDIPADWLAVLQRREWIEQLCENVVSDRVKEESVH